MRDIRYVVFHHPGPAWVEGTPFFEQEGVQQHVDHYRQLHASGRLALGGPFLDEASGGMMIAAEAVGEGELREFAAADPAVRSGLLTFELRPWLVAMKKA